MFPLSDIPETDLYEEYIRPAAGPGGQHVNRTANAVRLHFRFRECSLLPEEWKNRLEQLARSYVEGDEIILQGREFRSLQRNREAALHHLQLLLEASEKPPKKRRPTKPTFASKERRLAKKSRRSEVKRNRGKIHLD